MKIFGLQWFKGWTSMARPQPILLAQRAFFCAFLFLLSNPQTTNAQVVINEILPNGSVELKNTGSSMVNVGSYWLCNFPAYQQISNANLECGNMMMAPGSLLTVNNFPNFNGADGEMGLYTINNYSDPTAIIDYVEWGSTGHQRSPVAVAAMIWSTGDFVPAFAAGSSLEYSGTGDASSSWTEQTTPTICEENGGTPPCTAEGGEITGGPFEFCVGDGTEDNATGVELSGNSGTNSQWVVTDDQGNILGLPPSPEAVNFDEAPAGTCLIWHLSFEDGLEGAEVGMNAGDLVGCFDLSNSITVVRNSVNGGTIEGGPFEFCVGDGTGDFVSGITLTGNEGTNSQWVVTDDQGNILGLPPMPSDVNFDEAPAGTCLIWHLSFEDGLGGAEVGNNASELTGCFSLSNPISVIRNQPIGGIIEGGPFEFCVGDGIVDNVSGITLTGNEGTNSQWVVTDDLGNILGLPAMPSDVNFDEAPAGTCLIWHLSFEDGLGGAEVGNNASELTGCFNLSNPISVVRLSGNDCNDPCDAVGGTIEGGPFEFCVGDGTADNVSGITLTGNVGTNSQWVVTDDQGNILGLPPMPSDVNFDEAPAGTCLIWHLSFEDGLGGAEVGNNASELTGCFSLSNPISVIRNQPIGGIIEGGPFEFCVGDGIVDNVSGITLTGNEGTNSQWVVTDDLGNILGLPAMPSDVDFDGAPAGTCLIWHLSFEDGLGGAEVGNNASELTGCFNLSNPISVVRLSGNDCNDPCDAVGGTIEGGPFEFCVGDGTADNVSGITLTGNVGTNSQWVVTDDQGNILGLPPMPSDVDFDGAGGGNCLIWHLSFEDGLGGAEVGNNASELTGCFSLSNPITVIRNNVDGGVLEGGPFEFCVGDGVEDNVSGITLIGNEGTNSQWVVTDDQGNILGLPPSPEAVNFDDAPAGTCLIWHLSFEDGLEGAAVGNNSSELTGCFNLSNPITVVRNYVSGGTIEGGPFEFCVGDGIEDNVSGITLTGNEGTNSQWVVTDDQGNILGLPPSPDVVNFDDAPAGTCLIWHLSFEDGLGGAEVGNNASELTGCFSLSNPISVIRNQPIGGTIAGGPFEFCVGDGIEDNVSGITLTGNEGTNSQWVVTDDQGNILGLPPSPDVVNFDDAPAGNCLIWHLSFEDGLGGAEVGNNASELTGCFNLSNPITVVRLSGADCNTGGGDNDYVLVGLDELDIERNFINLGGIGVVSGNGDAEISEDSEVIASGTFVRADEACINSGAMANNVHAIPAQPNLPDFMENDNNVGNDLEVTVGAGETMILTESLYEDIRIREGATVVFSGHEYVFIEDLKTSEGATIMFDQCTNLVLSGRFELGYDNQFNLDALDVFVFAGDDASIRPGSTVYGVVYTEKDLNIRKGAVDRQTYLYGMFIGEDVRSRDYANYWYQQFDSCINSIIDPNNGAQNREEAANETAEIPSAVELSIFPNPAKDVANISISKTAKGDVNVAIYSATNQLVSTNMKISDNQGNIELNVAQLPAGVYFVKALLENGEVVTEKLIVSAKK